VQDDSWSPFPMGGNNATSPAVEQLPRLTDPLCNFTAVRDGDP
jgi:hypothetical protein